GRLRHSLTQGAVQIIQQTSLPLVFCFARRALIDLSVSAMAGKTAKIIAHRFGSKDAPETTLAALARSLELGVEVVEFDVQMCASGELVAFHDRDVRRTTNGFGPVKDLTLAQLKQLSAGAWFDPKFADEKIPLLEEVFAMVDGKAILNIEVKNMPFDWPEDKLLASLDRYAHRDKVIVSAFDHRCLARIHRKAKDLKLGMLFDGLLGIDMWSYAARIGATHWHPWFEFIRPSDVAEAHSLGIEVNAWTANTPEDWALCLAFGVDGIVTDDPAALKLYLAERSGPLTP
ncbi:MAG TPA: glycerophosphodiester phosphodiesterase family protein, partial [Candidatus Obscuribacterales bacterium]